MYAKLVSTGMESDIHPAGWCYPMGEDPGRIPCRTGGVPAGDCDSGWFPG